MEKNDSSRRDKQNNGKGKQQLFPFFVLFFVFLIFINLSPFMSLFSDSGRVHAQSPLTCELCRQRITGRYWQTGGRTYCNSCYQSYPRCKTCSAPMNKYHEIDGNKICPHCYQFKLFRCNRCNAPMFNYWIKDGKKYCKKCIDDMAEKCALCNKPLYGKIWIVKSMVTAEENKFCESCKNTSNPCYVCGMPVPSKVKPLTDGRHICAKCSKTAIRDPRQYQKILNDVTGMFEKTGLHVKHKPTLNVVDLNTLKKIQRDTEGLNISGDKMGYYRCIKLQGTNAFGRKFSTITRAEIYILNLLPPDAAFRVLSHELAHAWHEERIDKRKPLLIIEGFAEWVSYNLLRQKSLNQMAESMKSRDDVYGRGLKEMLKIQKKRGFRGVLEYVTQ